MMFKSRCIWLHKHHVFVASIVVHMCVEFETLTTFKRIAECFVFSEPQSFITQKNTRVQQEAYSPRLRTLVVLC